METKKWPKAGGSSEFFHENTTLFSKILQITIFFII